MDEAYDFPYDYEWEEERDKKEARGKRIKKFLVGLLFFFKGFVLWNFVLN